MKLEAETSVQVLIQHIRNDLRQVQSTAAAAREHEEVCSLISKSTSYSNVINKTTGIRYNMTSQKCRDGSLKNQPNWMGMTPQHFHTILTSCAILPPLTQIWFVFVSCVQRVVEGSGVGSGGRVVHFHVHGK